MTSSLIFSDDFLANRTIGFALFQYGLPALLGYVLHVGIAGRAGLRRPASLEERPAWFLGLWTAMAVTGVLWIALYAAYRMPLEEARTLFRPTSWALGAALLPGFALWLAWRSSIRRRLARDAALRADDSLGLDDPSAMGLALGDADGGGTPVDALDPAPLTLFVADASDDEAEGAFGTIGTGSVVADGVLELGALTSPVAAIVPTDDDCTVRYVPIPAAGRIDEAMRRELADERRLREETEKHLQVTRRALYTLDATARGDEDARADALIALEGEIEGHVRRGAVAEARATREECGRMQAETAASAAKREVLRLSGELRRNTEARARAVATAGKSVAFARRTLQARGLLEDKLRELEETLENRQATIGSLIDALEAEKSRTREHIESRARQLVLHERQLRERRGLEEVARSIEGKLSSRLVKKVARARPVEGV